MSYKHLVSYDNRNSCWFYKANNRTGKWAKRDYDLYNIPSTNSSKVNIITEQETKDSFVHQSIKQVSNGVYVNYHDEKPHKKGSGVFFISTETDSSVSVDYHQDVFHSNVCWLWCHRSWIQ